MKNKKLVFALTVAATLAIGTCGLSACELSFGTTQGSAAVQLSESNVELVIGEATKLVATASDGGTVTWSTSNEAVAIVKNGRVTAVGAGETTITATCGSATATCTVKVVAVTITLSQTSATIERGETLTLMATADREGDIVWSSSDETIATVKDGVVTAVNEGSATITATYKNTSCTATCAVTVGWNSKPADYEEVEFGEESGTAEKKDKFVYWNDQNWCGSNVVVSKAEYGNGKLTLSYSGANSGVWFGMQVFYKSSTNEVGKNYKATMTINSQVVGSITINGTVIDLIAGDNQVAVYYTESALNSNQGAAASLSIQMGVSAAATVIEENTITITTPVFEEYTPTQLKAPSSFGISPAKIIEVLDGEVADTDQFKLLFYNAAGQLAYEYSFSGVSATLDDSMMEDGTYTVKIKAIGSGMYTDSEESTQTWTWTVSNGGVSYDMENQGETYAVANPGKWCYWTEWAGISNAKYENGTITFSVVNGGSWYSNQIFYKNAALTSGTEYKLTCTITSTAAGKVTINGKPVDLVVGENSIEISYEEGSGASFSMQIGVNGTGATITDADITIANVQFAAI